MALVHTALSIVALLAGAVVVAGLINARRLEGWTQWFLASTALTCVTGFMLPAAGFGPSHWVGVLTLAALAAALLGRYVFRLSGAWRIVYAAGAVTAFYFNVFVLVAQVFLKVPSLHALAPTQAEPPFALAQAAVLVAFLTLGFVAVRRFRPAALA